MILPGGPITPRLSALLSTTLVESNTSSSTPSPDIVLTPSGPLKNTAGQDVTPIALALLADTLSWPTIITRKDRLAESWTHQFLSIANGAMQLAQFSISKYASTCTGRPPISGVGTPLNING